MSSEAFLLLLFFATNLEPYIPFGVINKLIFDAQIIKFFQIIYKSPNSFIKHKMKFNNQGVQIIIFY